jgi:hypothetical protein
MKANFDYTQKPIGGIFKLHIHCILESEFNVSWDIFHDICIINLITS